MLLNVSYLSSSSIIVESEKGELKSATKSRDVIENKPRQKPDFRSATMFMKTGLLCSVCHDIYENKMVSFLHFDPFFPGWMVEMTLSIPE